MDEVTFSGVRLETSPGRVMTPRATSEQLVDVASARIGGRAARVADVGTGSGAIAIAIALACPRAEIWATDTSASAAGLARTNVARHGLTARVHVRRGDLLGAVPGTFQAVVANLPYLPAATCDHHPELAGEPFTAVFAVGDGIEPYRRLVDAAASRLADDGVLILQLHRRVIVAEADDLPTLRAAFASPRPLQCLRALDEVAAAA